MYYTTPIYSFRCKCHLCGNWFEIRTDPKNTRYVVESGARQKVEEWDEADNGGIVLNRKEDGEPADAFAQIEKKTNDKIAALADKDRLEELIEHSDARNSDPFTLSQRLRKAFRKDKAELISESYRDDNLRSKYSLPAGLAFTTREDDQTLQEDVAKARPLIARHKADVQKKRCRMSVELGLMPRQQKGRLPTKDAQLENLKQKLAGGRRKKAQVSLASTPALRRPMSLAKSIASRVAEVSNTSAEPIASSSNKPLASLTTYSSD